MATGKQIDKAAAFAKLKEKAIEKIGKRGAAVADIQKSLGAKATEGQTRAVLSALKADGVAKYSAAVKKYVPVAPAQA